MRMSMRVVMCGLPGVRVSDVIHSTKSAGSTPPRMFCLVSRATNVRAQTYAHDPVLLCMHMRMLETALSF
jgi:hypothetical protein